MAFLGGKRILNKYDRKKLYSAGKSYSSYYYPKTIRTQETHTSFLQANQETGGPAHGLHHLKKQHFKQLKSSE